MKFLKIIFLLTLLSPAVTVAQTPDALDKLAERVKGYYNARQPDSLYALVGEAFRKQLSVAQFGPIMAGLYGQLGAWHRSDRRSLDGGVARYKAQFANGPMDFYLSQDKAGNIETLLFQPYKPDVARPATLPASNPLRSALDRRVDSVARAYFSKSGVVGASIGLMRNDSMFVYGYGETKRGNGQAPTGATVFEIGSISKTFTATLLADAVQRGRLKLSAPINKYLPDSIPKLQRDGAMVTVQMLSNHTSGLLRLPANLFTSKTNPVDPYAHYGRSELMAYLKQAQLQTKPGTTYAYSNLAVGLLGVLLENRWQQTYANLLHERIAKPLGMTETGIGLSAEQQARLAQGYNPQGDPAQPWNLNVLVGAGGIRSTVPDMLRYLQAELAAARNGAKRGLPAVMHLTQQSTFTDGKTNVALGWHVGKEGWLWHNGQTGGYSAFAGFHPERNVAVVVLTNTGGAADGLAQQLLKLP